MCIVMINFRGFPVFTANGAGGDAVTERAAEGWATRRTVVGGADPCRKMTAKVKFRSPARGRDISPAYATDTLCDGQGGSGSGGGSGRVRYRVTPAAATPAAVAAARAVRRRRARRGESRRTGGAGMLSWS
ncbi:hypothetical protein ADL30_28280 [Streptomyces sp. NRRL S-1521]|nr:hypothetical protein ADL30_28280 [Streptomyces sp. NRRL S-1521]